jgi:hypothetical protein
MAAAASLMFLIGAAGGVVTHAFTDRPDPVATQQRRRDSAGAGDAGRDQRADLETVRHEIASLRSEVDQRVRLVSTHASTSAGVSDRDFQQVRAMLTSGNKRDDELFNSVVMMNNSLVTVRADQNARINALDQRLRQISETLAAMQAAGAGGKQ